LTTRDTAAQAAIKAIIDSRVDFLQQYPERARVSDKAAIAVLDGGLCCQLRTSDGAITTSDMPTQVGGNASAPTPGWFMRAALAACDATTIAMRAACLGIRLDMLEVSVESESDARGLLGMDSSVRVGPLSISTRVSIAASGADPAELRQLVEWALAHSPVADAIKRSVPVLVEVRTL
jgi:uncharacterized OsmC-like protein